MALYRILLRPLLVVLSTGLLPNAQAQLALDNTLTPQQLVQDMLVGNGVTVSNVTFNGDAGNLTHVQIAGFNATATTLGLTEGVFLCTGDVSIAMGPNNEEGASSSIGTLLTDADLEVISGATMMDAAILEFDLVPTGDSIRFRYVFASEEYLEYVNEGYNDAFGFFLSGPGISGPFSNGAINIALVPGTADVVSVNSINDITNSAYYVDNGDGIEAPYNSSSTYVQFDGFTRTLVAEAQVQCGQTYHIKLAIADVQDDLYDSGIFLVRNSLSATTGAGLSISTPTGDGMLMEGCGEATVTVSRIGTAGALEVPIALGGAASAADHSGIPASVTIPDGQSSMQFTFTAGADGLTEADEDLVLSALIPGACSGTEATATVTLIDHPPLVLTIADPQVDCTAGTAVLSATASGGSGTLLYTWSNGARDRGAARSGELRHHRFGRLWGRRDGRGGHRAGDRRGTGA
ncbi:MAG: choice-of-anchor L domain-containing protein [Bacteroidetes bacterium]|nr:choice-of-anchor L domain-containing protein [Bacteroidota bacterium]